MKKKIIICILMILAISFIFFIVRKIVRIESGEQISSLPIDYMEESVKNEIEEEKIVNIVGDQGLEADEDIYEIAQEYDGREVVVVKANIKYKVALAGMIKRQKTEKAELNDVLQEAPKHTGIWVAENSREKFLQALKNITKATYFIDEEGFLTQKESWIMNGYDKSIANMLHDDSLHVFDINSTTYVVDEVTGEIQEYPFEEMDPYTDYEFFEDENKEMYIISEGIEGKVNPTDILKKIFE